MAKVDDETIIAQANQLQELNSRFKAIKPGHTCLITAKTSNSIAYTECTYFHPEAQKAAGTCLAARNITQYIRLYTNTGICSNST